MDLYMVRHAQPTHRANHPNPSLSDLGHQQAQALAESWGKHPFDALYSSDLQRAVETAHYLFQTAQIDPRLREMGGWSGGEPINLEGERPAERELRGEFSARVLAFMAEIYQQHIGQTVLCVAHGGIFDVLMGQALRMGGSPNMVILTYHTGVSHFAVSQPTSRLDFHLVYHNRVDHLPDPAHRTA